MSRGFAMRAVAWLVVGFCGVGAAVAAQAADAPAIVIPGKPGVPVIINGYDASYCVVEGDFGLDRPGQVLPAIVACPMVAAVPGYSGRYYPASGRRPGYGRREVEPPADRRLPRPAPSYYREWTTQSEPLPATIAPPEKVELNIEPTVNPPGRISRRQR
ncbi:MAG: hypothetical protein QOI12_2004 [Alphaproteobacteria bacterium]|nr:hypothetical protein [Alphaproteobacteria bacterium]